jgi:hypothetical protein
MGMSPGLYNEIKPLSSSGVREGLIQMLANEVLLDPIGFEPDTIWHSPFNPLMINVDGMNKPIMVFNVVGILFYTDDMDLKDEIREFVNVSTYEAAAKLRKLLITASDSSINELGKATYMAKNSYSLTASSVSVSLVALIAAASYTARYGF